MFVNIALTWLNKIHRLLHRKCDARIFTHEFQNLRKRTISEPSKLVSELYEVFLVHCMRQETLQSLAIYPDA